MLKNYWASATLYLLVTSSIMTTIAADADTYMINGHKIEVRLTPEKSVILLGEPIRLSFVVRNLSTESVELVPGAEPFSTYNRTGIRVVAVREDGLKVLPPPPTNQIGDAPQVIEMVEPGKSTTVDLFLPNMITIGQPGKYRLLCSSEVKVFSRGGVRTGEKTTQTCANITILPANSRAMADVIDRVGRIATSQIAKNTNVTITVNQATEALGAINDGRVVPWLVKMFQIRNCNRKYNAIGMLARFNCQQAFETLRAGLTVSTSDLDDSPTPAAAKESIQYIRNMAVYSLAKSPYPDSLAELKPLLHGQNDSLRESIVWALSENKSAAASAMLQIMAQDRNKKIRDNAVYYLEGRARNIQ